ncbi:hypothetical protein LTR85_010432 [Meristemomyces frigidus]|nr:hypothetical protein LTR85_010432 [Meristemomyces frigidus]
MLLDVYAGDEPPAAGWDNIYVGFVTLVDSSEPCQAEGCTNIVRTSDYTTDEVNTVIAEGSEDSDEEKEHIAGPDCKCTLGYSGWRISANEMEHCISTQCLAAKVPEWQPEPDDEDFETEAKHCFLTGVSRGGVDEWDVTSLKPARHGFEGMIDNHSQKDVRAFPILNMPLDIEEKSALPMHPKCFDLFKLVSRQRLGKVDIDALWRLREAFGDYENRFTDFPHRPDVDLVSDQWYSCEPGTEYLAANPVEIPGLDSLVQGCVMESEHMRDVVFDARERSVPGHDPFSRLSPELCQMLLKYQSRKDVANLRLVSMSFSQLPQTYFRHLIETEMPWMWELSELKGLDWHNLCCKLSIADGGAGIDEKERRWLKDVPRLKYDKLREELEAKGKSFKNPGPSGFNAEWMQRRPMVEEEAEAEIRAGYAAGMWPPRSNQALLGLRNRRRIWEDLEEIMRRIEALPPDETT